MRDKGGVFMGEGLVWISRYSKRSLVIEVWCMTVGILLWLKYWAATQVVAERINICSTLSFSSSMLEAARTGECLDLELALIVLMVKERARYLSHFGRSLFWQTRYFRGLSLKGHIQRVHSHIGASLQRIFQKFCRWSLYWQPVHHWFYQKCKARVVK